MNRVSNQQKSIAIKYLFWGFFYVFSLSHFSGELLRGGRGEWHTSIQIHCKRTLSTEAIFITYKWGFLLALKKLIDDCCFFFCKDSFLISLPHSLTILKAKVIPVFRSEWAKTLQEISKDTTYSCHTFENSSILVHIILYKITKISHRSRDIFTILQYSVTVHCIKRVKNYYRI